MNKYYRSKGGVTPFSGIVLILVIVVAITSSLVTYAWILSFNDSPIQQNTALNVENVRFYENEMDEINDFVEIVLKNSGSEAVIVDKIYAGTSPSNLMTMNMVNCNSQTQVITQGSTQIFTIKCCLKEQTKFYFKIATKSGQTIRFSRNPTIEDS